MNRRDHIEAKHPFQAERFGASVSITLEPIVIEASNLAKAFAGPALFAGLSFRADSGLVAVKGRNGSGKTTLLKILASLGRPSAGSVSVKRGELELSGDERRMAVGWSGPDLAFYEDFSAVENLAFLSRAGGRPATPDDLARRLEAVGLSGAAHRPVGAYSTGMKQRLRIAFALLFDPPLLLLDEPMSGLDLDGRAIVEAVVENGRRGGIVFVASNEPRDFAGPDQVVQLGT
jgi:ABC-type multidrug transport system ATPase subunit